MCVDELTEGVELGKTSNMYTVYFATVPITRMISVEGPRQGVGRAGCRGVICTVSAFG
jgi:hypothetical protein